MFVEQTVKRNRKLVETAFALHQSGQIMPDSYLIDMDVLIDNAKKILEAAKERNIRLYFMLKQLGRNPYIAKKLVELGYEGAVVVDFKEARLMMKHGIPIGNIGHLVQIPDQMIPEVVAYKPEVITVYSMDKIRKIDEAAGQRGQTQGILLRVYTTEDMIYSGQTAGFQLEEIPQLVKKIKENCKNIIIRGVTSFPCYLYDADVSDIIPTNNLQTVKKAVEILEDSGIYVDIVNTPSTTCVRTIQKMAEYGGNCGEPGHGLTGTTPMHAVQKMDETPAAVYVSEISHNFEGKAYCYGGGYYRRSHMENVLVGKDLGDAKQKKVLLPAMDSIDYHIGVSEECTIGDTAVMAFRYQIFVTRSDVVLVKGIQPGKPEIIGVYDSLGSEKE